MIHGKVFIHGELVNGSLTHGKTSHGNHVLYPNIHGSTHSVTKLSNLFSTMLVKTTQQRLRGIYIMKIFLLLFLLSIVVYVDILNSTELVCKYGEEKDLLYRLSCDCTGGNHDCASIFDTTERTTTGVYKLCNGINSTNLFQGGSLRTENVVVDSKQTQCVLIKTSVVPFYQFKEKKILSLGGLIISDPQVHRNELKVCHVIDI